VRRGSEDPTRGQRVDDGFSLIEQMIAIVIIAIVLLGLLSTLGATAQGIVTGRQRTIAISLARQVIETLQGAKYSDVVTGTGVGSDPLVAGSKFEPLALNEDILPGGSASYRKDIVATGTTFSLRTFVTTVPSTGYRRATVIIEWPKSAPRHTLRFSSFVFPLVNASYPASNGSAEVTGGLVTLSGCLGGDTFDDVHVGLPSVRADTSAATLRSAISGAGNATGHVEVRARPDPSTCTPEGSTGNDNCVRTTVDSVADNDSTTPTIGNVANPTGQTFAACAVGPTAGGVSVVTPAGLGANSMTSHAKTDACSPTSLCTAFTGGSADAVPFADAKVITNAGTYATFSTGGLAGNLWTLGANWTSTASVDHVETGTGSVKAIATVIAPALSVLTLPGLVGGAVKVLGFTATASAAAGDTTVAPTFNIAGAPTIQFSDGTATGYVPVTWVPGTALDFTSPQRTMTMGSRTVSFVSRVESEASATAFPAGTPRPKGLAQNPTLLRVTVTVTISPSTLVTPTTTTSTTTSTSVPEATTSTIAPLPVATDTFTIVVDYGRVSANGAWLATAA
jgi:prepilin-type N-terminal cleavage/methylation domain-containing protein